MNFINYEDFQNTADYQTFIEENPDVGNLKVEVFTAYGAIPIPDTEILITKTINNNTVVFFRGMTNSSGIIDNITLPSPPANYTPTPYSLPMYTIYDLTAIHEGYESIKKYNIGIFGGVKVIQYVKMTPEVNLQGVDTNGN